MHSRQSGLTSYFRLGANCIRINFPDKAFKTQAFRHIFLSQQDEGTVIATISYILDRATEKMLSNSCRPNVVGISREDLGNGRTKILLRMFTDFTVALDIKETTIQIHYPSHAPVRLLLDDVLHAAMQPILDRMNGFILHGACMVKDNQAIVFMGNSGSGKSTAAFNLTRFGFHLYADDAVLVTPHEQDLYVWPLSREFSLRPLSFRLFENQNIEIGPYCKDGQKYYFKQNIDNLQGAILKHICFLTLGGNAETATSFLSTDQARVFLTENDRHFSFMGRKDAKKYAGILAQKTPAPMMARLGTDLVHQGHVFLNLVSNKTSALPAKPDVTNTGKTRDEKTALIRRVWTQPVDENIVELIPFLGDYDPHVFKLALSFFQTLPLAKLQVVAAPRHDQQTMLLSQAPWLQTHSWRLGCEELFRQTGLEVLQRFAFSWIASAPLIYPFLKVTAAGDTQKSGPIEEAWSRYKAVRTNAEQNPGGGSSILHLFECREWLAWPTARWKSWCRHHMIPEASNQHLFLWIETDRPGNWEDLAANIRTALHGKKLTIVPVIGKDNDVKSILYFYKLAARYGLDMSIHRNIPLCCLKNEEAAMLISTNALDHIGIKNETAHPIDHQIDHPTVHSDTLETNFATTPYDYYEKPYPSCMVCDLCVLGLCRGGFFTGNE